MTDSEGRRCERARPGERQGQRRTGRGVGSSSQAPTKSRVDLSRPAVLDLLSRAFPT